jgi:hypothetical protein
VVGIFSLLEWVILPSINPLRRSKQAIMESLLKETPIGTTRKEVQAFLKTQKWARGGVHWDSRDEETNHDGQWLSRSLGIYPDVFETTVYAEWHFNSTRSQLEIIGVG